MNMRFVYLYRDSGNFKKWGDVVFSNEDDIEEEIVMKRIIDNLEEGLYFRSEDLQVADLHFEEFNPLIDHHWHEFHCCSITTDAITDCFHRDIKSIIAKLVSLNMNNQIV